MESEVTYVIAHQLRSGHARNLVRIQKFNNSPATKAIPVAILTAFREEQDLVKSYRLGVNSYIQKPEDFEQFRATVKQASLFWLVVNQLPPAAAFQEK